MRTSTLLVLSLSTAATLVTADSKEGGERGPGTGGGGALQALLERMQKTKHDNHARGLKDAQVRPAPADYASGDDRHNSTLSSSASDDAETTVRSKFVKSTDRPSRHGAKPSVESAAPKHRLRSTESARRAAATKSRDLPTLERQLRVAESNKPLSDEEFDSITAAEAQATPINSNKKVQEKAFGKKQEDKRWVWGTAIIQDDTPAASNVPAVGQNANYLNSNPVNTPAANLVAPSFPPLAAPSFPPQNVAAAAVVKASSQTTPPAAATTTPAARQNIANRKKVKPAAAKEKRWTWGTSIIQDGSPDAPPVGENANLLSSGTTIALNTPAAVLTTPSFPPLAEPTTSSSPAPVETPATAVQEAASSVQSSAAPQETIPATPEGIQALLAKLQAEIDMLGKVYAQASATSDAVDAAAATSPAENAKRWVWGPSIIQDDSPSSAVPPIGQNTNLFNTAVPVATPTAQLVAPSFPPIPQASVPVSVPAVESAAANNNSAGGGGGAKALASDYAGRIGLASVAAPAPVTPQPAVAAPDAQTTTSAHRNRKSEADSIRSVRNAQSKTAALEWHLVNQKRKVGGMNKLHKRQ